MAGDAYALAEGCDALVVCTEWNEFKQLDLARDPGADAPARSSWTAATSTSRTSMAKLGFRYRGFGRGYGPDGSPCRRRA